MRCDSKKFWNAFLLIIFVLVNCAEAYLSPSDMQVIDDGRKLLIVEKTANQIAVFDTVRDKLLKEIQLDFPPTGIACSVDGSRAYVTAGQAPGYVLVLELESGTVLARIAAGHSPLAPVLSKDGRKLYVCSRFETQINVIDLEKQQLVKSIEVKREPIEAALTPDGKYLYVANHMPDGRADLDYVASKVSVIDTTSDQLVKTIQLVNGAEGMRELCVSRDGRFVYAAHLMARYQVPTSQIERGWINTNAISVISVEQQTLMFTVLLDDLDLGFANPWAIDISADGSLLAVSSAGNHQVRLIDLPAMIGKIQKAVDAMGKDTDAMHLNAHNDLSFISSVSERIQLQGKGPRAIRFAGENLYTAEYFSDSLSRIELDADGKMASIKSIPLGPELAMTEERLGEFYFNDASLCFQNWQSCASCHSDDGRTDALNWDLLNDGIGNPKNVKSLLYSHQTPPAMTTGVRDNAEAAVRAGIMYIQFAVRPEADARAIDAYLKSLRPVPSPYLVDGELSEPALRGKALFAAEGCADCHSGAYFTDMNLYELGTGIGLDAGRPFDTPTLIESWRTSPYLHDGRAVSMEDLIRIHNPVRRYNSSGEMKESDIRDLAEYVNSL